MPDSPAANPPPIHWNPAQYQKFSDQRLRPALELLDRIPLETAQQVYDLGCGTGHITRLLAERWPSAEVVGIDNSAEMLQKAQSEPDQAGAVRWLQADIRSWVPMQPPDLIYSNAALHWVEGHEALFPRLARFLKPGGCLAVQMPLSWGLPSHVLMRETLANGGPGGRPLGTPSLRGSAGRKWVEEVSIYYGLLAGRTVHLDIWETEYLQILESRDPVLEWVRGTGLRPILQGLDDTERGIFLAEYGRRLREAYPARPDGRTLYPFRRLFIIAQV